MLRVWMEKESSLGVLGLQKSESTESSHPPHPKTRTSKIFRKWLKLHARVRAALQLHQRLHGGPGVAQAENQNPTHIKKRSESKTGVVHPSMRRTVSNGAF